MLTVTVFRAQVGGTSLSRRVRVELESYGFKSFEEIPDGFRAYKSASKPLKRNVVFEVSGGDEGAQSDAEKAQGL